MQGWGMSDVLRPEGCASEINVGAAPLSLDPGAVVTIGIHNERRNAGSTEQHTSLFFLFFSSNTRISVSFLRMV